MKQICPHRGFPLSENGTCQYHGWPKCRFSEELSPDAPFDYSLFDEFEDDIGHNFYTVDLFVKAPYFLWMQNTMDPNHLKTVHRNGFANKFYDDPFPYDVSFSPDKRISSYKIDVHRHIVSKFERLAKAELPGYFYHASSFPYTSMTSFLGVFHSIEIVTPVKVDPPNSCLVQTKFFSSKKNKIPSLFYELAKKSNLELLEEDRRICEEWAKTYNKHTTRNWLKGEERIRAYVELLNSPVRENP